MNKEDIVAMAIKSHLVMYDYDHPSLEAFAKLVAEKEREACANICDEFFKGNKNINYSDTIAICIRARAKA